MKSIAFFSLAAFAIVAHAQYAFSQLSESPPHQTKAPYHVTERGAHHRVWRNVHWETNEVGEVLARTNGYVELATGLHHQDTNGAWVESREEIEILPNGGAVARRGQHKVTFPPDIYDGQIELQTPDGQWLRSRVVGLAYWDTATDQSVLIAVVTNSLGELHGSNVVLFPDAFTDFRADVRLTFTKAGFESDVVLRERIPSCEKWGMNPATTRLQVWTEFFNPPQPEKRQRTWLDANGRPMTDESLIFGELHMIPGKAFSLNQTNSAEGIRVAKQWVKIGLRDFLVEEVEIGLAARELENLPRGRSASLPGGSQIIRQAKAGAPALPAQRQAGTTSKPNRPMRMAQASAPDTSAGFVLDYVTVNPTPNYTFRGNETYYVSGSVYLSDTTTIEGGTVIKYNNTASASITLGGPLDCRTDAYRPAVLTSKFDNTVGEPFASGTPTTYGGAALYVGDIGPEVVLKNARVAYASTGIEVGSDAGQAVILRNVQFVNCETAVRLGGYYDFPSVNIFNGLIHMSPTATAFKVWYGGFITGQHLTVNTCGTLVAGEDIQDPYYAFGLQFKHSIFANVTTMLSGGGYLNGDDNGFFNNGASGNDSFGNNPTILPAGPSPFQIVGAGNHYLATNPNGSDASGFRNRGLAAIDATLVNDLKGKTTYPPLAYSGTGGTLSSRNLGDVDIPDLGYHYTPLDYTVSGINGSFTFLNGVAIGIHGSYGLYGGTLVSVGTPRKRNQIALYSAVMEQPLAWGANAYQTYLFNSWSSTTRFKFTDVSLAGSGGFGGPSSSGNSLEITDCLLHGVALSVSSSYGGYGATLGFTNNIIERCDFVLLSCSGNEYFANFYNNLFLNNRNLGLGHACSQSIVQNSTVKNNLFVNSSFTHGAGTPQISNNGFFNTTVTSYGSAFRNLDADDFLPGPLGNYYYNPIVDGQNLATLIDAGSGAAPHAGLYHHTVSASPHSKEGNSLVDIGFHYVALDGQVSTSQPIDTLGNGTADYLDDANGNGIADPGETAWFNTQGQWNQISQSMPARGVHAHLLPTGKLLLFDSQLGRSLYDPVLESASPVAPPGFEIYCSGHTFMSDGTLFVAGGHGHANWVGLRSSGVYSPLDNFWTRLPVMNEGRWYPPARHSAVARFW